MIEYLYIALYAAVMCFGFIYYTEKRIFLERQKDNRWSNDLVCTSGGVLFFLPFLIASFAIKLLPDSVFLGLFLVMLIGFLDDTSTEVNPLNKLIVQITSAILIVSCFEVFNWWYVFFLVFISNAFNLTDNMNGIAGIIAIGCLWAFGYMVIFVTVGLIIFLQFNIDNKIYMGDAGSLSLGMFLGYLCLLSFEMNFHYVFLLLAIPIVDACFVIFVRTINKKPFWIGDKNHLSHILARRIGESKTILIFGIVQALLVLITIGLYHYA